MESHDTKPSAGKILHSDEPVGAFPFPLSNSQEESRYLTWVRNHSNYMAVRGFLDYFRSISVLLRGIVLNFLIFLPALLLVAIGLAYSHHWMLANPYFISSLAVGVTAATILLFPIAAQLFKISSYRRGLESGSESSVKFRDKYERLFGSLLMLLLATAALESLPWVLEYIHDKRQGEKLNSQGGLAAILAILTFLSGSDKLLSTFRGAKKTAAMGFVGVLGVLLPILVVLFATDYLLYGFPPSPFVLLSPIFAMALFVFAIAIAIGIGVLKKVFTLGEIGMSLGLFSLAFLTLSTGAIYLGGKAQTERAVAKKELESLLSPYTKFAKGNWEINGEDGLDETVVALLGDIRRAKTKLIQIKPPAGGRIKIYDPLPEFHCKDTPHCLQTRATELGHHLVWENFRGYWGHEQQAWRNYKKEVSITIPVAWFLAELMSMPGHQLQKPRAELAQFARSELEKQPYTPPDNQAIGDDLFTTALSRTARQNQILDSQNDILKEGIEKFTAKQRDTLLRDQSLLADNLIAKLMYGEFADLRSAVEPGLPFKKRLTKTSIDTTAIFIGLLAVLVWLGCWLTVDVNLTSIHGLYRDRLASAFLIGKNTKGDIDIEEDLDLHQICRYDHGSVAPYHLINVALNLQASKELRIRDRQSDFFIFSKRFIGGQRTGYCRSEIMEQVFPQSSLATAMAISAAAASPNMGRGTSPLLVAFMTMLNIRLGFWLPNPGLLESSDGRAPRVPPITDEPHTARPPGFTFDEVFVKEIADIRLRWQNIYTEGESSCRAVEPLDQPTVKHGLVGIGFSGGGIRSAAINLGITQALHAKGVFQHLDYMSTVSGGGYLGSSISSLMRSGPTPDSAAALEPKFAWGHSDMEGSVSVDTAPDRPGEQIVRVEGNRGHREYRFSRFDKILVHNGDRVKAGEDLISRRNTIADRFRWRVRPIAFLREMISKLDETHRWVNLSDGGHIENLATVELLRRRCKYIIIGDGEADPNLHFAGLATLMRTAYLDLGIKIDLNVDAVRLRRDDTTSDGTLVSSDHWAIGKIYYPTTPDHDEPEEGYLLYLKSSYSGSENEIIREYRNRNPAFPHQTTADQFFDEGQFEAYRALGQNIAEKAFDGQNGANSASGLAQAGTTVANMSYAELEERFKNLWENRIPKINKTRE